MNGGDGEDTWPVEVGFQKSVDPQNRDRKKCRGAGKTGAAVLTKADLFL